METIKGKYLLPIMLVLLWAVNCMGFAYRELPANLDGTMRLYDFSDQDPVAVPDSLHPAYITYVARHGARYLSSSSKVDKLKARLEKLRLTGKLTKTGRDFLSLLDQVERKSAGQWGMLSEIGIEEERRLGREMADSFPQIFSGDDAGESAISSYVPRVVQTMNSFSLSIAGKYPGLDINQSSGAKYDPLVRFFDVDPAYVSWLKSGELRQQIDSLSVSLLPVGPAERLVGADSGLTKEELQSLSYQMYGVLQGLRASGLEPSTNRWMSVNEYEDCWRMANVEKHYKYWANDLSRIPAEGARPLLFHLLKRSVAIGEGEDVETLEGVFGHAETLLPLFSLLGIGDEGNGPAWDAGSLTPLGANLAIIYYRSAAGRYYVSMRLNGKNIPPLGDPHSMIVPLEALNRRWFSLI